MTPTVLSTDAWAIDRPMASLSGQKTRSATPVCPLESEGAEQFCSTRLSASCYDREFDRLTIPEAVWPYGMKVTLGMNMPSSLRMAVDSDGSAHSDDFGHFRPSVTDSPEELRARGLGKSVHSTQVS